MLQKSKSDLYCKLADKLESELKGIKNHNTPEAREKLFLLEKCKNERHIRNKSRPTQEKSQERLYMTTKPSFHRPSTCCPRTIRRKTANSSNWDTLRSSQK